MDGYSTPARAQRGQHKHHQHSRSGAASTPTGTDSEHGSKSTGKRKVNKSGSQNVQPQPAWDNAPVGDSAEGHFDNYGRYVSGQHESLVPDESPGPAKGRKTKGKQNHTQNGGQLHQQSHVATAQPFMTGSPAKIAYAGPTFHASPAASALPKPMFMSKSVPGDAKPTGLQSRLEQEIGESGSSAASTPVVADKLPASVAPPREESPLELFFKADRAEKSKGQALTGSATPGGTTTLSVAQSAPPGNSWSNIYQSNGRHHQRTDSSQSQRGMFALELDGTSAQSGRPSTHPTQNIAQPATAPRPNSQAESDPIRRFLLETANGSSPSPKSSLQPPQPSSGYNSDQPGASPFYRPSLAQRSSSGPSTPMHNAQPPSSLHYGNRNLSPLFQAAKSPPNAGTSQLRHELGPSPPQQSGPHQQWASIYQQHTAQTSQHSLGQGVSNAVPPPNAAPRSYSYGGQAPEASHDTKSMEDDLKRILKLTASSNGATGVQG